MRGSFTVIFPSPYPSPGGRGNKHDASHYLAVGPVILARTFDNYPVSNLTLSMNLNINPCSASH